MQAVTAAVQAAQSQARQQSVPTAGSQPAGVTPGVSITPSAAGQIGQAAAAQASAQPAAQTASAGAQAAPTDASAQAAAQGTQQAQAEEPSLSAMGLRKPEKPDETTIGTLGYLAAALANPRIAASSAGSKVDSAFQQTWNAYQQMYSVWQ